MDEIVRCMKEKSLIVVNPQRIIMQLCHSLQLFRHPSLVARIVLVCCITTLLFWYHLIIIINHFAQAAENCSFSINKKIATILIYLMHTTARQGYHYLNTVEHLIKLS